MGQRRPHSFPLPSSRLRLPLLGPGGALWSHLFPPSRAPSSLGDRIWLQSGEDEGSTKLPSQPRDQLSAPGAHSARGTESFWSLQVDFRASPQPEGRPQTPEISEAQPERSTARVWDLPKAPGGRLHSHTGRRTWPEPEPAPHGGSPCSAGPAGCWGCSRGRRPGATFGLWRASLVSGRGSAWSLKEEQVRQWAAQTLLALEALHQQGVLCRDLQSPESAPGPARMSSQAGCGAGGRGVGPTPPHPQEGGPHSLERFPQSQEEADGTLDCSPWTTPTPAFSGRPRPSPAGRLWLLEAHLPHPELWGSRPVMTRLFQGLWGPSPREPCPARPTGSWGPSAPRQRLQDD